MRRLFLAAAAGIAATLSLAQAPASAALVFTPTTFGSFSAVIDQTSNLGWVSPNIATGDTFSTIAGLCPGGTCTGALAGLHWASAAQVEQFWTDVGIPLNSFGSYSSIGTSLLPSLIDALGPTHITSDIFGEPTDYLGGITNNPETLGIPNTSYMFHFFSGVSSVFDNESAFTTGAGNGFAELPATRGWFFFNTSSPVPEPSTWAMMLMGLFGVGYAGLRARSKNRASLAFE